jgi:sensor domain CHASE-containing protein
MAIGVFEFLLGAVIVGGISGVLTSKHNLEREKIKARSAVTDEETQATHSMVGDLHHEVARLKERVQVLERLVTDDDRKLSDEIERLRRTDTGANV